MEEQTIALTPEEADVVFDALYHEQLRLGARIGVATRIAMRVKPLRLDSAEAVHNIKDVLAGEPG